jgi:hypothetical protein
MYVVMLGKYVAKKKLKNPTNPVDPILLAAHQNYQNSTNPVILLSHFISHIALSIRDIIENINHIRPCW